MDSDFKNKNDSLQFIQTPESKDFIAKFPALKEHFYDVENFT